MSVETRLTDKTSLTAVFASNNLEFYVVDRDNKTEHSSGSSFKVSKTELKAILGLDILLNQKFLENPSYADIAAMITDQANQTVGKIQHVIDASGDVTVNAGFAYYEYLGPATASLQNYRKLSNEESDLLQNNTSFATFKTAVVSEALGEMVISGGLSFEYNGADITKVLFDKIFTEYLKEFASKLAIKNFELVLFNRTKQKTLLSGITAFVFSNVSNSYYKVSVNSGMLKADVSVNDIIDVKISVSEKSGAGSSTGLFKIGDYMVDRRGGINTTIKAGNILYGKGSLLPGEFIIAESKQDEPTDYSHLTPFVRV